MSYFCGEALCKAAVSAPRGDGSPVVCGSCGRSLYPGEVLARLPPSATERRAELMAERGSTRVAVAGDILGKPPSANADASLDRLLSIVDIDPVATAARKRRNVLLGVVALAVVAIAAALIAVLMRGAGPPAPPR